MGPTSACGRSAAVPGGPPALTDELETVCHTDLDGTLPNGFTAHPKRDPRTGELFAVAYHWGLDHLQYLVVGAGGRVRKVEPVDVTDGPMVHDMSLTERLAVVYDLPVTFSLELAAAGHTLPYAWNAERPARLGVMPREGSGADLRWFEVDPCYVFHALNAHDEPGAGGGEGRLVLHVVRHDRTFDRDRRGPGDALPTLWRWTVDLDAGTVAEEQLDDRGQEFPRVAEGRVGLPSRHGWAVEAGAAEVGRLELTSRILRHDLVAGTVDHHPAGPGRVVGEAVPVPRDGAGPEAEDDAWLLSLAHDQGTGRGELVVWAPDAPGESAVARVPLPVRVPAGFHGSWIPSAS